MATVFPSAFTSSCNTSPSSFGSIRSNTRRKVSLSGTPFGISRYCFSHSYFPCPVSSICSKSVPPLMTDTSPMNTISTSLCRRFLQRLRLSVNFSNFLLSFPPLSFTSVVIISYPRSKVNAVAVEASRCLFKCQNLKVFGRAFFKRLQCKPVLQPIGLRNRKRLIARPLGQNLAYMVYRRRSGVCTADKWTPCKRGDRYTGSPAESEANG